MPVILIAEDHSIVRVGTSMLIKESIPKAEVAEVETFDEVIREIESNHYDLLLLDIHIPAGDNLQMIDAVHLRKPGLRVLMFSSYEENLYAIRSLKSGAMGYIHKRASAEQLIEAVRIVLAGGRYMSEEVKDQFIQQMISPKSQQNDNLNLLSNRELEVMRMLLRGATTSEIGNTLNIRFSTVSTYKMKIFEKLNVSNLMELAEKVRLLEA